MLNGKRGRATLLRELLVAGHLLGCCAVNVTEVFAGARPHEEQRTEEFLNSLEYYGIEKQIAQQAGLLKRDWSRRGIALSTSDVTIAAVALSNDLALITDNRKHYPMRGLRLHPLP